jgi:Uncharacterized protein conserved in bacteria
MTKTYNVEVHMEVVGSDGKHVGVVDHLEGADKIKLTKDDPKSGGRHHFIQVDWVDRVADRKVHLNKPAPDVMRQWEAAA